MRQKRKPRDRKCRHCKRSFMPDPHNAWHQRYCTRKACQKVRQRRNNRLWLRKNPGWWRGYARTAYIQDWRRTHPKYWRKVMRRLLILEVLVLMSRWGQCPPIS